MSFQEEQLILTKLSENLGGSERLIAAEEYLNPGPGRVGDRALSQNTLAYDLKFPPNSNSGNYHTLNIPLVNSDSDPLLDDRDILTCANMTRDKLL